MIAEIILNTSVVELNRTFDYKIPENLDVQIGDRVLIPFGNKKQLDEGIVINVKEKSDFKTRNISSVEMKNEISEEQINLAKWMANRYFCNLSDCIKLMLTPGTTMKNVDARAKDKSINAIILAKEEYEILQDIEENVIKSKKQKHILNFVIQNEKVTIDDIKIFTDGTPAIVKTLVKNGYLEIIQNKVERNFFSGNVKKTESKLKLTLEQKNVIESIDINNKGTYLIHGITGSGKTEIYLQLIEKELKKGNSSIMLVPEISLTPQTVNRFVERFGEEKIAVLHSKLSIGERYDSWKKIKSGEAKIIIGARSAIFAPINSLGIIIIDEEHDESYSSEKSPRYDAKEIANFIAKNKEIPLVLGSATPDIKTYYKAMENEYTLLTLSKRANKSKLPNVEIIDLREELASGNKSMISTKLKEEISKNLAQKKQTILFINRRGFSTFVICRDCGHVVKCKRCDLTLTYHKTENILKCHFCGYEQRLVSKCPECGSENIKYFGGGTQKLEEEVKKDFPQCSTIRMDIDTVNKKNSHEKILSTFKNDKIDILIGTQMVVKGHDFPNVTLVGVISADTSLNIGDYRAEERTFQTLTQVAGRAGRGEYEGKVIIQTYNPDNFAIEDSKLQDYKLFYDTEIQIRKALKYPPFCDIIVIGISSKNKNELREVARKLHNYLKDRVINEKFGVLLYSPVPAPVEKRLDRYRWRMIIKCIYDDKVNDLLYGMQNEFSKMKSTFTRVSININPNNMM